MGKYDPLARYLKKLPDTVEETELSFSDIERIIGDSLPESAWEHNAWWANEQCGSHVQARAWVEVGWDVIDKNQDRKHGWVRFARRLP